MIAELQRYNTHGDAKLCNLRDAVNVYARSLPAAGILLICGQSDIGKSLLARCVFDFWRRVHIMPARIAAYPYFARWIKALQQPDQERSLLCNAPFLVIDDLGAESKGTGHRAEEARALFQEVLDARTRKPTLITSNLSAAEIAEIDPRLISRIQRLGRVIESTAAPYRSRQDAKPYRPKPPRNPVEAPESEEPTAAELAALRALVAKIAK